MTRRDIPNLISALRVLLAIPVTWLLLQREFGAALVLFAVAGFSDGLDGFLAKRYGWTSRLGALLDPLADKALLVLSYIALGWLDLIPLWLVVLVVLRDVIIVTGAMTYHFWIKPLEAAPTWVSKINTAMQILLVLAVVVQAQFQWFPLQWMDYMIYTVLATTLMSGIDYVWSWTVRAKSEKHRTRGLPH